MASGLVDGPQASLDGHRIPQMGHKGAIIFYGEGGAVYL